MILVTGGAGFIGVNFVKYLSKFNTDIVALDNLSIPTGTKNIKSIKQKNFHFVKGSLLNKKILQKIFTKYKPICIVNFAAETHVDRSISNPKNFINSNIIGLFNLLEISKNYFAKLESSKKRSFKFLHISTDEVYGSLKKKDISFKETNKYYPNSPYSASKAAADHLVYAWYKTYNFPSLITNCSNNYGPYQYYEKLIPLTILKALNGENIPIYGSGKQVRDWLYVYDHCSAIHKVLKKGKKGETYNIGGNNQQTNLETVSMICGYLDKVYPRKDNKSYKDQITFVKDRPGHDFRYAVNNNKIKRELNWKPKYSFSHGIKLTVDWYLSNMDWLESSKNKKFKKWEISHYK